MPTRGKEMFKDWKVVNVFKYFSKENRERHEAYTTDKDIYLNIGSCFLLMGLLFIPALFFEGKLDQIIQSSTVYIAGAISFLAMYFVFKKYK